MKFILLHKIGVQCNISKRKESGSFCEIKTKKKHLQFLKTVFIQKSELQQCSHPGSPRMEEAADLLMNQFHTVEARNIFWAFYVQFGQVICL